MLLTMIDGRVLCALTDASTLQSPICKQTAKGSYSWTVSKPTNEDALKYGISPLHAYIRFLEFILAISYRLGAESKRRGYKNDPEVHQRREVVLQGLKLKLLMYINPDRPRQGFGSTTDGNSARRFFCDPATASKPTGIDQELKKMFSVIIGSG
ncbi:hypothetical protein PR048_017109 [Dryococelus australis]|uniref:Uncharacterized protein n=1 Tax=Dryococelus australis TaxID=614101 RepID=A0ABQ9H8L3_9NEOP|nr:hypothetical protein PR048_017109 [Dryococelus australis]